MTTHFIVLIDTILSFENCFQDTFFKDLQILSGQEIKIAKMSKNIQCQDFFCLIAKWIERLNQMDSKHTDHIISMRNRGSTIYWFKYIDRVRLKHQT